MCYLFFSPLPFIGFAFKLSQPQDSEEEEKEGESWASVINRKNIQKYRNANANICMYMYILSVLTLFISLKASKTVETATGQAMETEAAE